VNLKRLIAAAAVTTGLAVTGFAAPATAAGNYFQTLDYLNLRECPSTSCTVLTVIPINTTLYLNCWWPGTSINGDNVWYDTTYGGQEGMVSGYYMNTGADPNPNIYRCP
jgi:hypothetical protein